MTTLVTGATGNVGSLVLEALLEAGRPVRAASRNPRPGAFPDGAEPVRLDLTDPATLPAALDGAEQVFLYAQPDEVDAFTAAATAAGVQQVVLLSSASVLRRGAAHDPIAQRHLAVERALDAAGIPRTFVRPGAFATNALRWTSVRTDRVLRTAFPDARTSMVHERDIAEVAAAALLDDAHVGRAHPLLGPGPTSAREQVADIAAAIGEPVAVEAIDVEAYREQQRQQLPPSLVDALIALEGEIPSPPPEVAVDAVQEVLGRPPLPFAVWARDHADDFR